MAAPLATHGRPRTDSFFGQSLLEGSRSQPDCWLIQLGICCVNTEFVPAWPRIGHCLGNGASLLIVFGTLQSLIYGFMHVLQDGYSLLLAHLHDSIPGSPLFFTLRSMT